MLETEILPLPALADAPNFSPESRVWIYPCSRKLSGDEAQYVENQLLAFCETWTAHNQALLATAEVFENRLAILLVDETRAGASGCSIDKSVHFLENLGQQLGVDFFDRLVFGWEADGAVVFGNKMVLEQARHSGQIHGETLMLNTLAKNLQELRDNFWQPHAQSWHRRI